MELIEIEFNKIIPNQNQPRKYFDEESLKSLKESIRNYGLLHPISVSKNNDDKYVIVSGERRFRAISEIIEENKNDENNQISKETFDENKFKVVLITEHEAELTLIENIQRENLNHIELAEGLKRIQDNNDFSQEDLGKIIGKSSNLVSEILSINKLSVEIRNEARIRPDTTQWALVAAAKRKDSEKQKEVWDKLKDGKITVSAYRKNEKDANQAKVITYTEIKKVIKSSLTQIKNILDNEWESINHNDKELVKSDITHLFEQLQKIEGILENSKQCSSDTDIE